MPDESSSSTGGSDDATTGTQPTGTDGAGPRRSKVESTGAITSGPTGGAEPVVPHGTGEPEKIELLEAGGGSLAAKVVPAVLLAVAAAVVAVVLMRRGAASD
ncbi:MAG: hypothetical protein R2716_09465 [Microthrixaceae bacterium]